MNKRNIITLLIVLLLVILAVAYIYINNIDTVNDKEDESTSITDDEGYEAVDSTDKIIHAIEDSMNYFE